MRWNGLFAELEAEVSREADSETLAMAADEFRLARGRRLLTERIADLGELGIVAIRSTDGSSTRMKVDAVGDGWVAGREHPAGGYRVQALAGIVSASGAGASDRGEERRVVERTSLPLRLVLRDLCRRRTPLLITTPLGSENGTIDAVGADHIELAVHPAGTMRRRSEILGVELLPLHVILAVVQR